MKVTLSQIRRLITEQARSILNEVNITASKGTNLYGEGQTVAASTDGSGNITIDGSQGIKTYGLTALGGTTQVKIENISEEAPEMPIINGSVTIPIVGKKVVKQKLDQEVANEIISNYTQDKSPFTIEGEYTITFTNKKKDLKAESSREVRGKK